MMVNNWPKDNSNIIWCNLMLILQPLLRRVHKDPHNLDKSEPRSEVRDTNFLNYKIRPQDRHMGISRPHSSRTHHLLLIMIKLQTNLWIILIMIHLRGKRLKFSLRTLQCSKNHLDSQFKYKAKRQWTGKRWTVSMDTLIKSNL